MKCFRYFGSIAVFLSALPVFGAPGPAGPENRERLRLVRADSLVSMMVDKSTVMELFGHVVMEQGAARLTCRHARYYETDQRAVLTGDVTIRDKDRTLKGDIVVYEGKSGKETATGNASLRSGDRLITAGQLVYEQNKKEALAFGSVRIEDFIQDVVLTGRKAAYDRVRDYGRVEGDACIVKRDTASQDSLRSRDIRVESRILEAWGKDQHVVATDSVRIHQGDLEGFCRRAGYWAEGDSLVLQESPHARFRDQRMKGEIICIHLEDLEFRGGQIRNKAEIVSLDSAGVDRDVLTGRNIRIDARKDTIREVTVEGQARSVYHVQEEAESNPGINSITGDRLIMTFEEGKLHTIRVFSDPGLCTGEYKPLAADTTAVKGAPSE